MILKMKKRKVIIIEIFIVILIYFFVNSEGIKLIPKCWIYETTGIMCLSCGGTRCIENILKGNLLHAFYYNSVIFIGIFYLLILNIVYLFNLNRDNKKFTWIYPKWWYAIIFLIIWIIYAILRVMI